MPDRTTDRTADWTEAVRAAAELTLSRVPDRVVERAGHIVADTVGVSVAGHRSEPMRALTDPAADPLGSPWPAPAPASSSAGGTVLGPTGGRTDPEVAAFLNATAGSFLELDEGVRPTGHPAMQVVPAAVAVAEALHRDGRELLRAVLAGYEVTGRLFTAYKLRYPVHPHGHFGAVGAAVAVALLTGGDPVAAAEVAATSPVLSTWEACYEGATARNTYMGTAAQQGVRAARLVHAGFTGSRRTLPAAFGEIAGELVDPSALTARLDHERLAVTRNYFKRHSACALTHGALDAVLSLDPVPLDRIRAIRVETIANNMKVARQARPNALSARFSLPYAVAAVLTTGRTDAAAFDYDPQVASLAERVQVVAAPDLEERWPDAAPVRVTVTLDGAELRAAVDNPYGHHSRPLTEADLWDKFRQNVGPGADALWATLTRLPDVADCATVFERWR